MVLFYFFKLIVGHSPRACKTFFHILIYLHAALLHCLKKKLVVNLFEAAVVEESGCIPTSSIAS